MTERNKGSKTKVAHVLIEPKNALLTLLLVQLCRFSWFKKSWKFLSLFYSFRDETYFFNVETKEWTPGPSMKNSRGYHGCVGFEGKICLEQIFTEVYNNKGASTKYTQLM